MVRPIAALADRVIAAAVPAVTALMVAVVTVVTMVTMAARPSRSMRRGGAHEASARQPSECHQRQQDPFHRNVLPTTGGSEIVWRAVLARLRQSSIAARVPG